MPNLHTPDRLPGESKTAYSLRRKMSRASVRAMTLAGIGLQNKLPSQRERLRNAQRKNGAFLAGSYGKAMTAYFATKQRLGRRPFSSR